MQQPDQQQEDRCPRRVEEARKPVGVSDHGQLVGFVDQIESHLGIRPKEASADSGYLSESNLAALEERGITAYIATGRAKRPADAKHTGGPLTRAMRTKLKRGGHRSR